MRTASPWRHPVSGILLLKQIYGFSDEGVWERWVHDPYFQHFTGETYFQPYEFGCKVSITTTNARSPGGQFVLHAKALHGRPYDGHTLASVLTETQALTGIEIKRAYVDKGYIGHNAPKPLRVYRSGQKRGVYGQIKRELRRRAAIEPVIGHLKSEGHLGRNYLKGRNGDHANAVLAATGHNFQPRLATAERPSGQIRPGTDHCYVVSPSAQNRFLTVDARSL